MFIIVLIDIALPMAGCTVALESNSVAVMCVFPRLIVTGYLVLLRFRDNDILNVNRSTDVMSPFLLEAFSNGPHHVIVFPIMEDGIIGTSVLYSEMVEVTGVPSSPPPSSTDLPTTSGMWYDKSRERYLVFRLLSLTLGLDT